MPTCIVKSCNVSQKPDDPHMALHRFPSNLLAIKAWLQALAQATKQEFENMDELSQEILAGRSSGQYCLCSRHFTVDSFYQRGAFFSLKKEAVPTIFPDEVEIKLNASWQKDCHPHRGEPAQEGLSGGGVPTSVMGLHLRVIKLEEGDSVPLDDPCGDLCRSDPCSATVSGCGEAPPPCKKSRTLGTSTDFFPNQRHKATITDNRIGMRSQEVQTENDEDNQRLHGCKQEGASTLATGESGVKDLAKLENPRRNMASNSCLSRLLMYCRCLAHDSCHGSIVKFNQVFIGATMSMKAECSYGHQFQVWDNR